MGQKKDPPGGRDKTPIPPYPDPVYLVRFIFHGANNLPAADIGGTSDPFVLAQLNTGCKSRHKSDPKLRFRSATARKTLSPQWEAEWVVAGVPARGAELKTRVYDEDNGKNDDLLGRIHIHTGELKEGKKDKQTYKLVKRGADLKVWACRSCHVAVDSHTDMDATVTISFEVLGKSENVGKAFTMNCFWWIHQSPVLGKIVGTTSKSKDDKEEADFQANEIQLRGPVPNELYHRYVEFKSFVSRMYEPKRLRGRGLHYVLHRQHEQIYHFDAVTEYGRLEGPGRAMTRRFLDMAHWGEGGRIFTYVLRLDGLMRFTETGPEFGIDMLSKHVMHADLDIYVACAGEFIVRKFKSGDLEGAGDDAHPGKKGEGSGAHIGDEEEENKMVEQKGDNVPPTDVASPVRRDEAGRPVEEGLTAGVQHDVHNLGQGQSRKDDPGLIDAEERGKSPRQRRKEAAKRQYDRPPEQSRLHGPDSPTRSTEPSDYELVIDNDSGTYRPDKELLPVLAKFFEKELEGIHVLALHCYDDRLKKIKKKQQKIKEKAAGGKSRLIRRASDSSLSGSDQEDVEHGRAPKGKREKAYEAFANPAAVAKGKVSHALHKDQEKGEGDGGEGSGDANEKSG